MASFERVGRGERVSYLGEEHSRQKEQHVQRPKAGVLQNRKKSEWLEWRERS